MTYTQTFDVENRLVAVTTLTATTVYTYDDANRLINVGGVAQTRDNNGNLTGDGTNTYAYDSANRLKTLTQGANTYTFGYNGLGDRLQQTVNGNTTTYVLDLNAGLTQVLADGTNTYLYGLNRIGEQQPGGFVYHLPDALGSVRQLANSAGHVTLAKSYQPYGSVMSSAGTGISNYGFAGEFTDASGLIHLRARFYGPQWGRLLTRDPVMGQYIQPQTFNPYAYSLSNPVNYTDPSGHDPYWCEGRPDEDLCYYNQGGDLTAPALEATYGINPDRAIELVRREFNIKLPPGYQFRFAFAGGAIPLAAHGSSPWFYRDNWHRASRDIGSREYNRCVTLKGVAF